MENEVYRWTDLQMLPTIDKGTLECKTVGMRAVPVKGYAVWFFEEYQLPIVKESTKPVQPIHVARSAMYLCAALGSALQTTLVPTSVGYFNNGKYYFYVIHYHQYVVHVLHHFKQRASIITAGIINSNHNFMPLLPSTLIPKEDVVGSRASKVYTNFAAQFAKAIDRPSILDSFTSDGTNFASLVYGSDVRAAFHSKNPEAFLSAAVIKSYKELTELKGTFLQIYTAAVNIVEQRITNQHQDLQAYKSSVFDRVYNKKLLMLNYFNGLW